ncbi:MAG: hypothetical protein WCF24_04710 [Acidimicrobiales bacterium]
MAAVATLLFAIGVLAFASSTSSFTAADVISAVGIGGWALLALARAARINLAEQRGQVSPGRNSLTPPWLIVAGSLVLLAVSWGLPVVTTDQGVSIASGILRALGAGGLAIALAVARSSGVLVTRSVALAIGGLAFAVATGVAIAVVAAIVFTPSGTLTGLRIGVSLAAAFEALAFIMFGLASWTRVGELVVASFHSSAGTTPAA